MAAKDWEPLQKIAEQYRATLIDAMKRYFGLNALEPTHWVEFFAHQAARRMVARVTVYNARSWRHAAHLSMRGPLIYGALRNEMAGPVGARVQQIISENARLIKSLPLQISGEATSFIQMRQQEGVRASVIASELRATLPRLARARISLIARTETSKASTALTQARSEEMRLAWYVWRTSEDQRVRPAHRRMNNVLVNWRHPASPERLAGLRKPPAPYAPGNIYNCRCYPEPLLRLSQVNWPHRVFWGGTIQYMTRSQFRELAVTPLSRIAA